jgi:hypothetical protein
MARKDGCQTSSKERGRGIRSTCHRSRHWMEQHSKQMASPCWSWNYRPRKSNQCTPSERSVGFRDCHSIRYSCSGSRCYCRSGIRARDQGRASSATRTDRRGLECCPVVLPRSPGRRAGYVLFILCHVGCLPFQAHTLLLRCTTGSVSRTSQTIFP